MLSNSKWEGMVTDLTLHHVINSSLRMALRMLCKLYCGCTRHLEAATMDIWRGPVTPMGEMRDWRDGVRRKGTGRLASSSPTSNAKGLRKRTSTTKIRKKILAWGIFRRQKWYRIVGNFRWSKFSRKSRFPSRRNFHSFNFHVQH